MLPSRGDYRGHINEQGASVVSFTHEQNSIFSQKQLNDIVHEHTIIFRQLFSGHVVGSQPTKRKKHLHRMIIGFDKLILEPQNGGINAKEIIAIKDTAYEFFRLSFLNCTSCVFNCDDLLCVYFFIP